MSPTADETRAIEQKAKDDAARKQTEADRLAQVEADRLAEEKRNAK